MAEPKVAGTAVTPAKASMLERLLALAKTPDERTRAYEMAEQMQRTQVINELVAEVKAKSWGDRVAPALRVAIVRWALGVGADPVDEVDVLGGGPYLNGRYWMRLCAAEPDFLRAEEVWVHADPRITDPDETARRLALRIQYAIPDEIDGNLGLSRNDKRKDAPPVPVKAAVLVFGHFKERGPFVGKKWSPSRANDDVGLDFPEPSALTRAWRKMALQAVRQQPRVTERLKQLFANQARTADLPAGILASVSQADGDGGGTPAPAAEPAPRVGVIEKHNPNAACGIEGEHPREDCGMFKPKA